GSRPGYQDGGGQGWSGDELGSAYGWATDDAAWPTSGGGAEATASNAVRGFPPAPGEPLPVYPPGPFAAWHRGQPGRAGAQAPFRPGGVTDTSQLATATITPDEFDTDYSLPAIKDPIPARAGRSTSADRPSPPARGQARPETQRAATQVEQRPASDSDGRGPGRGSR